MSRFISLGAVLAFLLVPAAVLGDGDAPKTVEAIKTGHDRTLIRDLIAYIADHPKAGDLEQAYMTIFEKAIDHDWFRENEDLSKRYLAGHPEGAVRSLAQIVGVMARAQAEDYPGALTGFQALMTSLGKPEQEEFAAKFADQLASTAAAAGEVPLARKVYQALLERYSQSPALLQKVKDDVHRLDMVGNPAPSAVAKDVKGDPFRLENLKGKYILVDFWATWCGPCLEELPRQQAAFAKYHDKGLEIVSVSLDEKKDDLVTFLETKKLPWRQIHNASSEGDMVEAFGVGTIPATFLIDRNGTIIRLELRGQTLDTTLAKLFGGVDPKKLARPER